MIKITENASKKITEILSEEQNKNIRIFVQGGGCSGMQYGFTLDHEHNDDDFKIPLNNFEILVDSVSAQYLQGATVDFIESAMGENFSIDNPNAETTCGCGSSFSIG
jgi:iron-sulfur cluster insertion protein